MYVRIFRFNFFEIQNMCKMHFKLKGAYAPIFQNITLQYIVLRVVFKPTISSSFYTKLESSKSQH
jgi:hypothetical protein